MATPSAALAIQPPPSPLDQYARLVQLKTLLGGQQLQQAQLAGERQQQAIAAQLAPSQVSQAQTEASLSALNLKNQQRLQDYLASGPIDFGDPANVGKLITQGGPAAIPMVAQLTDIAQKQASTGATQLESHIKQLDQARGVALSIAQGDQDAAPAAWKQAIDGYIQQGTLQPGQIPDVYPGAKKATALANTLALGSQLATEQAAQTRAQAAASQATTSANRLTAEEPGLAANAQIAGQKAALGVQGTAAAESAGQVAGAMQASTNAAGGIGGASQAIDQAAQMYATTGQLPRIYGAEGGPMQMAIIRRASELFPGQNFATNAALYTSNKAALDALTKNYNSVNAFEQTAGKNLDLFINQAQKVVDSGSPWINKPLRSIAAGGLGSADQAAYNAARQVAINEIAKVTSNPVLAGALSDSARHEVESFNPQGATLAQTLAVAKTLRQDMGNRISAYQDQIQQIRGQLGQIAPSPGAGTAPAASPQSQPATAPIQYAPGLIRNGYRFKGGDPTQQSNWEKVSGGGQ